MIKKIKNFFNQSQPMSHPVPAPRDRLSDKQLLRDQDIGLFIAIKKPHFFCNGYLVGVFFLIPFISMAVAAFFLPSVEMFLPWIMGIFTPLTIWGLWFEDHYRDQVKKDFSKALANQTLDQFEKLYRLPSNYCESFIPLTQEELVTQTQYFASCPHTEIKQVWRTWIVDKEKPIRRRDLDELKKLEELMNKERKSRTEKQSDLLSIMDSREVLIMTGAADLVPDTNLSVQEVEKKVSP